jgi:hypothetical protein
VKAKPVTALPPVLDLMATLKQSLAKDTGRAVREPKRKTGSDRRQSNLLLPVAESRAAKSRPAAAVTSKRHRRA